MTKIILSLPEEFLEKIDEYKQNYNYNRSEFIRFAIRKLIYKEESHETS